MLELWEMQGPLWSTVVAPDRVLPMGQKEMFDIEAVFKQTIYTKQNCKKKAV